MTTIDQLPPAAASADTDLLLASQGGIARHVSRAQLLASAQPAIALPAGQLLGRGTAAGPGGPQPIVLGANLALAGNVLTGAAPFAVGGQRAGSVPAAADLVAVGQGGSNATISYAQFMAGIGGVAALPAGAMVARATNAATTRTLADHMADGAAVEDFGAAGDGITDDSAAIAAALASGQPVRFGPRSYAVAGQFTITGAAAVLQGVPGQTVLRRIRQATGTGAWISVQSVRFAADGIVFDANSTIATDSWGVLVAAGCTASDFHRCTFANARGATMGAGLVFAPADPAITQHAVHDCEAYGNAVHGIWAQATMGVLIDGCRAHDNGQYGICMDYADPALAKKLRYGAVRGCAAWNNLRGISVGNFNATNTNPPVWGNANPDAIGLLVAHNICHDNSLYGIAAAGLYITVAHNTLVGNGTGTGGGILANIAYGRVTGNMVTGAAYYGIDAGGSISSAIDANHVVGATHGITPGGSTNLRVCGNTIQDCTGWSVLVNNVETDGTGGAQGGSGGGRNFGIACSNLLIADNFIGFSVGTGGGGILLLDNPANVRIVRNSISGTGTATIGQALWAHAAAFTVEANSWNFSPRANVAPVGGIVAWPDLLDRVTVTGAGPITGMPSLHAQAVAGQVAFVAVSAGGSGYTTATVTIAGDGAGATAVAQVAGGQVIGITLTAAGSGYSTATATIAGDGTGAAATVQVGLPVPDARTLTVRASVNLVFARPANSNPAQQNWSNYDFTAPAATEVTFVGRNNAWRAANLALADYVIPDGAGGTAIATQAGGDLVLAPTGRLRVASTAEPTGITTAIGRGSPQGVVAAPPGSDYRNLNGGAGNTFWIKQTGTGTTGWAAVA